jgi:shikimate kinase
VNVPARTVALIGLMGSGKSAVGRRLAARLDRPFRDTDTLIEQATGLRVAEIFARHGEATFRRHERQLIARLPADHAGTVLALGGGMFVGAANIEAIRAACFTVWLRVSPHVALERLGREPGTVRPLLDGADPAARLEALDRERRPWYARADAWVDVDGPGVDAVVERVMELLVGAGPCA